MAKRIMRSMPRVVLPELPFRRASTGESAIMARKERNDEIQ